MELILGNMMSLTICDDCKLADLEKYCAELESRFHTLGNKFDGELVLVIKACQVCKAVDKECFFAQHTTMQVVSVKILRI